MKHAILLSAVPVDAAMKRYCRPGSFVVACDAGYRNSDCLGVRPNLIVGDFDSAPQPDTDSDTIVLPLIGVNVTVVSSCNFLPPGVLGDIPIKSLASIKL